MGRRGPAPMPTRLRLLHGDHPERVNRAEPRPRASLPECPAEVSPAVRDVWSYTMAELEAMKIVTAADRDALLCYCEAVITHREASALLAQTKILVKGALGGLVRNPALAIQRDAARTMLVFAREFGLTPSARSQIKAGESVRAPGDDLLTA